MYYLTIFSAIQFYVGTVVLLVQELILIVLKNNNLI